MKQSLPILSIKIKISRRERSGSRFVTKKTASISQYIGPYIYIYIYMVMLTSDLKVMINNPFKTFFKWIINYCPKDIY